MSRKISTLLSSFVLGLFLFLSTSGLAEHEGFDKENRDKVYEFYGRDGHVYDTSIEYVVRTIPSSYGRLVSVQRSPFNPKERELWFEANDGTVRRVVLVPIKKRKPPYMIYQEVIRFERD